MMVQPTQRANTPLATIPRYGVFVVFALLIVYFALTNKRFLSPANLFLILQQAAPLGIGVVGIIYVLMVVGIDISVGRNMFFVSTVVAYLVSIAKIVPASAVSTVLGITLLLGFVIFTGLLFGALNGLLVTRFKLLPFIVTLATGSIARGFGLMLSGSASLDVTFLGTISNGRVGPVPNVLLLFVLLATGFDFVLRRTPFGRHLVAIGNSPQNARKAGIKVDRYVIFAYMICGALAAFGGILSAGQIGSVAVGFGEGNEFIIISAAVIGGASLFGAKGNIVPGAMVGILLITTVMNGLAMINASPYIYTIVRGLIIFIAVSLDSINFTGELR